VVALPGAEPSLARRRSNSGAQSREVDLEKAVLLDEPARAAARDPRRVDRFVGSDEDRHAASATAW
jgi:hypothetical protein